MRLYLSSFRLGDAPAVLSRLVRGRRRGWVVMNALDGLDEGRRQVDSRTQVAELATLGLEAADLDLRALDPTSVAEAFGHPDFVWVRGGNVFTLRMAMARSGLDRLLVAGLEADELVYSGFSAGACVLAPSLSGLELCDPPEVCEAAYGEVRWDGLGVLDRPVVPHLHSPGHPETKLLAQVAARYEGAGQRCWALRDGQALVVDGPLTVVVPATDAHVRGPDLVGDAGMTAAEVHRVVDALAEAGCVAWLAGGWGVDALLGRQTRRHRDLDLAFDADHEAAALEALGRLGYVIETDQRPVRLELAAPPSHRVDLHPVVLDDRGDGVQAGFDGTTFSYPATSFTTGSVAGRATRCLSVDLQLEFHGGYEPRDVDRADVGLLHQVAARRHDG